MNEQTVSLRLTVGSLIATSYSHTPPPKVVTVHMCTLAHVSHTIPGFSDQSPVKLRALSGYSHGTYFDFSGMV